MSLVAILGTLAASIVAILALFKGVIPVWRWFAHNAGQVSGALDNLAGRDTFVDPATGKSVDRIPPIGERFAGIEDKLDALAETNTRLDSLDSRVVGVEKRLDGVETAVGGIIADKFENGAHAALQAVEKSQASTLDVEAD